MKINRVIVLTILMAVTLLCGCTQKVEIRTDIDPLEKHMPNLGITEVSWYGGTKDDIFSGIGPATYIICGAAKVDEEFLGEIESKYSWGKAEQYDLFDFLKSKSISDYLDDEKNYVYSQDFCNEITNTHKLDVLVSFNNKTIVFYWEFINF